MKKIIFGISSIVMAVAVVAGSAYALLTSNAATVSGISVTSGTADLQVWNGSAYGTDWNSALSLTNLYPGYGATAPIKHLDVYLKNNSSADISLNITMGVSGLTANELAQAVQVQVKDVTSTNVTEWKSLNQLGSTTVSLPGTAIAKGAEQHYEVYFRVPYYYGANETGYTGTPSAGTAVSNEIVTKTLSGVSLSFTGVQN